MTPTPRPRLPGPSDPIPVRAPPPAEDREPPLFRRSPLTFGIIAVNVAVFLAQLVVLGNPIAGLARMPDWLVHVFGANDVNMTLYEHRYETLLTSCFVHGSLLHIAFNMVALRQVGPFVERTAGAARMAPLYLIAGIAGSIGSAFSGWLSGGQRVSVGASGAICGLIGAALVIGYRLEGARSPIMRAMAGWLATLFAIGFLVTLMVHAGGGAGGFDNAAHFCGALAGASIAIGWTRGEAYDRTTTMWIVILCSSVVAGAAMLSVRYAMHNPFALMSVDARVAYATAAIDEGRCRDARAALRSLERLAPKAPEVALVAQNYHHRCVH